MPKVYDIKNTVTMGDTEYSKPTEWRMIGAQGKSQNIINLCKRNGLQVNKFLEVGSGDGAILRCLDEAKFCPNAYSLEVSDSGIDIIRSLEIESLKNISAFNGYSIPFEDNHFDLVILSHVLEHVEFERTLLRELQRVSKYQLIEIPLDYNDIVDEIWTLLNSYGHLNVYTPTLLRFLLKAEKFKILDDLPSRYHFEVKEYLHFEYHKNPKTPEAVEQLRMQFAGEEETFRALPKLEQERSSNAYTILTRKATDEELFDEHVAAALSFLNQNRQGDASLVLSNLKNLNIEGLKPLPPQLENVISGEQR